jgi:hypothetical protein
MPFYLATPRLQNHGAQTNQMSGRSDYVRTEPTQVMVFGAQSIPLPLPKRLASLYLGVCFPAIKLANLTGEDAMISTHKVTTSNMALDYSASIDIRLPTFSLGFLQEPSDIQKEFLETKGATELDITGKGHLYTVDLSPADFDVIVTWDNLNPGIAPVADTMKITDAPALTALIRYISTAAVVVTNIAAGNLLVNIDMTKAGEYTSKKRDFDDLGAVPMVETKMDFIEKVGSVTILAKKDSRMSAWGTSYPVTISSHGIFCPFEPNYANPDYSAWTQFAGTFKDMMLPNNAEVSAEDLSDLNDAWVKGLARTIEGYWLAHMMATVMLAHKVGGRVFFQINNGIYEGTVVYGTKEFSLHTRWANYDSKTGSALVEEISAFTTHSKALSQIIADVPLAGTLPEQITSMRMLRKLVYGTLNNGITTVVESRIKGQMKYLNFNEKPVGVNPQSVSKFLDYATPGSAIQIPDSVFLHRDSFFSSDDIELALSMFGARAPSPHSNGRTFPTLRITNGVIQGTNPSPQVVKLQMKRLQNAANDWKGFFNGGSISFDDTRKVKNSRAFKGPTAASVWGILVNAASKAHAARKNKGLAVEGAEMRGNKRKGNEDEDTNRFIQKGGSKKFKFENPF